MNEAESASWNRYPIFSFQFVILVKYFSPKIQKKHQIIPAALKARAAVIITYEVISMISPRYQRLALFEIPIDFYMVSLSTQYELKQ